MRRNRNRIAELVEDWTPRIRSAFLAAIGDITSNAEVGRIEKMLERGDFDAAVRALGIEPLAYRPLEDAIRLAHDAGGAATINDLPRLYGADASRIVIRWDARNREAEDWLRDRSGALIANITQDQRAASAEALRRGMEEGRNPRNVALDLIGRVNPVSRRREGGVIGLSAVQETYVANARAELISGDAAALRNYLTRARRDKRFDKTIQRAILTETAVPADAVSRILGRYADGLLNLRGETIARTEAMSSLHHAQREAIRQTIAAGAITQSQVEQVWQSAGDSRVRDTHSAMDGQRVKLDQPFQSPSGATLRYPGDERAPAEERINCRCSVFIDIDFLSGIR